MNITVFDDLTSHTLSNDGVLEFFLPPYNPMTLVPFSSAEQVEAFIRSNVADNWWMPYVDPEAREQERLNRLADSVRETRNTLLAESDWTQVADAPVNAAAWATYRQALRDITNHVNFPQLTDEDWPIRPE